MDEKIKKVLAAAFAEPEAKKMIDFLERGFFYNGQIVIASVFLYARDKQLEPGGMLSAVEAEWQRNWCFQHPELRADPDAPGNAGRQKRISLDNIYQKLGLTAPSAYN